MPQISISLSRASIDFLKSYAKKNKFKSVSCLARNIVERGIENDKHTETLEKLEKQHEFMLRLLNFNHEILRKLYDSPSLFPNQTVEKLIDQVESDIRKNLEEEKMRKC